MKRATPKLDSSRTRLLVCLALLCTVALPSLSAHQNPDEQSATGLARTLYRIKMALDFDARTFQGTERVRWTNRSDHATGLVFFHLYANVRVPQRVVNPTPTPAQTANPSSNTSATSTTSQDEPRIDVTEVRSASTGEPLGFALDDQETTLRVNLNTPLPAGATTEIDLKYKGTVPDIDPEETSLFVHVLQQVGAALRSEREMRRARDVNFRCRSIMMLGTSYPVLATREGDDWQRKVEPSIGDMIFTEAADYQVSVEAPSDVNLYASGEEHGMSMNGNARVAEFSGENLRDFALFAGRELRAEERVVDGVKVRSVFPAEHEQIGKRVLGQAADSVRTFTAHFGAMPYKTINIVDVPLVAGLGSAEFAGLCAIASAYYVDFNSPLMRNLPEMIREQRSSVEESLEWTVAHVVAHQWWGAVVGSDPERDPVMDEALANWSALLYYREVHGEERAQAVLEDQLRGVYKIYRTFGGEDMTADHDARDYRNFFQYAAIVASKGALMFAELHRLLGHEKFFRALRNYYKANTFEIAEMDDLRGAFVAEAALPQRRAVTRTFNRWLSGKHGDEDISPPDPELAAALGLNPNFSKNNDRNAFARLGKFFWQQMTRIR